MLKSLSNVRNNFGYKYFSTTSICNKKVLKSGKEPYDKRFGLHILDAGPDKPGGSKELQEMLSKGPDMPRQPGIYTEDGKLEFIPEMVPEFVVPDLKDFKLKPYVCYTVKNITQNELTPKEIFDVVYAKEIMEGIQSKTIDIETAKQKLLALKTKISTE